jgi:hypothetical protein
MMVSGCTVLLEAHGIRNYVIDPASLQVDRRMTDGGVLNRTSRLTKRLHIKSRDSSLCRTSHWATKD